MAEKHRGDVEMLYSEGLFSNTTDAVPIQLFQIYEREVHGKEQNALFKVDGNTYSLLYGIRDNAVVTVNDIEYSLRPHTLLLISDSPYSVNVPSDCSCEYIRLDFSLSPQILNKDLLPLYAMIRHRDVLYAKKATQLLPVLTDLIGELCLLRPQIVLVKGLLDQILVTAYRSLTHQNDVLITDEHTSNIVGHTVYAIVRYIDEHLYSIHNLSEMAAELGYSYNYLSHLFRRKTGTTIQAYVSRKKIEKSTELLSNDQYSVTEIASLLNYDCIQSFSKAFKKAMGISPTEYREAKGFSVHDDS